MKVKSESEIAQSATLSDPMDCSLPGSSAHGIFQARILEWGAIAVSLVRNYICEGFSFIGPMFAAKSPALIHVNEYIISI